MTENKEIHHYSEIAERLNLYILCVHHWGTSWTNVATEYRE